jgi:predicted RND superfamily exporter protein
LTLRGLIPSLVAIVPLIVGTFWTLGLMGIHFNLANSIFMALIVGAGVEYGVIIIHRWREGRMPSGRLPVSTAKGVILAALTTTLGFGSLMISRHQGIFSLGLLALTGSLCVLLATIVLLPAILALMKPSGKI